MAVLWLIDGTLYQEPPTRVGAARAPLEAVGEVPQPDTPPPSQDRAEFTPEARRAGFNPPIPPPNSEVAAQPQFRIEGASPRQQREIDPVNPLERYQSVRPGLEDESGNSFVPVRQLMSSPALTVTAQTPVEEALNQLKSARCHHLPVVDEEDRLLGLVSDRDLLGRESGEVGARMARRVLTASPDTDLREVAKAFAQERFHSLVVMEEDRRPLGIVTSYDLLRYLARHPAMALYSQTS